MTVEEEALEEEKKKNLSILQSILGSSQQTCSSKTPSKAKTFRSDTHILDHSFSFNKSVQLQIHK